MKTVCCLVLLGIGGWVLRTQAVATLDQPVKRVVLYPAFTSAEQAGFVEQARASGMLVASTSDPIAVTR